MPPPQITLGGAKRFQYAAALMGTDAAPYHGDCLAPIVREMRGVRSPLLHSLQHDSDSWDYAPGYGAFKWPSKGPALAKTTVYVSVRCRTCQKCLAQRAKVWTARGMAEISAAPRSWFGTLTVRPSDRFILKLNAMRRTTARLATPWDQLSGSDQFKAIAAEASPEITKWLKRVRKETGARLRYLLVCEAHKSGDPHWHILLHEYDGRATKAVLEEKWRLGFSHWRLINGDKRAALYASKYLAKSALTRVRASQNYGSAQATLALIDAAEVIASVAAKTQRALPDKTAFPIE